MGELAELLEAPSKVRCKAALVLADFDAEDLETLERKAAENMDGATSKLNEVLARRDPPARLGRNTLRTHILGECCCRG